jgi:hypothetical protein
MCTPDDRRVRTPEYAHLGSTAQCEGVAIELDDFQVAVAGDDAVVAFAQFGCGVVGVPDGGFDSAAAASWI